MNLAVITQENLQEIITTSVKTALEQYFEKEKVLASKKKNYTVKEVAKELNVSTLSVRNYIEKGYLKAFKIGNRVLISYESIEKANNEIKSQKYKR